MTSDHWHAETDTLVNIASANRQKTRVHRLHQTEGPDAPKLFLLDESESIVGRSGSCSIRIDSSLVSRQHMSIRWDSGEYVIRDLDSHNGIYLNEVPVHSASLRDGDSIQLGDVLLRYYEG